MTDEELIARLRLLNEVDAGVAADRIEALLAENKRDGERAAALMVHHFQRAEQLEEALLWCSWSAAFNEGGVAREGWLKVCAPLLKGADHE